MSKIKNLIYDIVEEFNEDRVPMSILADKYGMPLEVIAEILRDYGYSNENLNIARDEAL